MNTENTIREIKPGFGAIDIGQEKIYIACAGAEVRSFGTCVDDFELAAIYLREKGVRQVAMEATGVYWIPLHDLLQERGFEVMVFNGANARNMPGHKTDVQDCQWHAILYSYDLLVPCFIPNDEIRQLRCLYRLREDHLQAGGERVQHMQRALDLMNVRIHVVISQIHGVSGQRIVRAIIAGERCPEALAALCDKQILKHKREQVTKSLRGHWQDHHVFALQQAMEGYDFCQQQMKGCDQKIADLLVRINANKPPQAPEPGRKLKQVRHNAPAIEGLHGQLLQMTEGRDATKLPGISPLGFMKLLGETGTDLSAWRTVKHFTSWAGLAPGSNQSGKTHKRVRRKKTVVGQIFREAVLSLSKSKYVALGGFYRRLRGKKCAGIAVTATARKLAELYYHLMTKGLNYVEEGLERYEQKYREQTMRYLQKTAKTFGFTLTPEPQPA